MDDQDDKGLVPSGDILPKLIKPHNGFVRLELQAGRVLDPDMDDFVNVGLPFGPSTRPAPPLFPREQRRPSDRPRAVQGAKRRSEPLTARTDLESSRARGKGVGCRRGWTNGL